MLGSWDVVASRGGDRQSICRLLGLVLLLLCRPLRRCLRWEMGLVYVLRFVGCFLFLRRMRTVTSTAIPWVSSAFRISDGNDLYLLGWEELRRQNEE